MNTNPQKTNKKIWLGAAIGIALIVLAVCSQRVVGQTNILNDTGNAGVGTTSPTSILTVQTTGPDTGERNIFASRTPAVLLAPFSILGKRAMPVGSSETWP